MKRLSVTLLAVCVALMTAAPGRCGGTDEPDPMDPTPEMEEAMGAVADVITANQLAVELTSTASEDEPSLKDANCPVVTREIGTVTLDYGAGCTPASGLVRYPISGSVSLDVDRINKTISSTFDQLTYDVWGLDGSVSAGYSRLGGGQGVDLTEAMALTFTGSAISLTVDQDVTLNVRSTYLTVDGTVDYSDNVTDFAVDVDNVTLDYTDLVLPCPLPNAGTITVSWGTNTVSVTFDTQSPTTGIAHVDAGPVSGPVNVCAIWLGNL